MAGVTPVAAWLILSIAVLHVVRKYWQNRHRLPLPPGPRGMPILGNVNDLPKPGVLEWHHWLEHKDKYGPISSVTVMGQTIVIINDPTIAFDLLRDRSAIYSSRPNLVFAAEMVGWRHMTGIMPYTDTWKIHRKNITQTTSTNTSLLVFDRIQQAEAVHFLVNLLESPDRLSDHIRHEAGSVILKIIYGYNTIPHENDPLVDMASTTVAQFADATVPGRWAVDIFPFLRYLPSWAPGASFKRTADKMARQLVQCTNQPYEFVKQQMRDKRNTPSFLSQCIETIGTDAKMDFIHKWVALAMYLGGSDTSVTAMMTFFLALLLFPDVQEKAQEEIDRVIGPYRLPVSQDLPQLPYIEAILKETHRWHLVAPMGLPHATTKEDTYRGYRIPKGSLVMANTWHFMHDPAMYHDPMAFRPERFLASPTHKPEPDPRNHIFGYGRRICPGRYVADNSLFITIAQTLAVFDVGKFVRADGTVEEPDVRFMPGTISYVLPFRCSIKPRSDVHEALIREAEKKFPYEQSDAEELKGVRW